MAAGAEVQFPVSVLLRTCQPYAPRYRVAVGPAELVAALWVAQENNRADLMWLSRPGVFAITT